MKLKNNFFEFDSTTYKEDDELKDLVVLKNELRNLSQFLSELVLTSKCFLKSSEEFSENSFLLFNILDRMKDSMQMVSIDNNSTKIYDKQKSISSITLSAFSRVGKTIQDLNNTLKSLEECNEQIEIIIKFKIEELSLKQQLKSLKSHSVPDLKMVMIKLKFVERDTDRLFEKIFSEIESRRNSIKHLKAQLIDDYSFARESACVAVNGMFGDFLSFQNYYLNTCCAFTNDQQTLLKRDLLVFEKIKTRNPSSNHTEKSSEKSSSSKSCPEIYSNLKQNTQAFITTMKNTNAISNNNNKNNHKHKHEHNHNNKTQNKNLQHPNEKYKTKNISEDLKNPKNPKNVKNVQTAYSKKTASDLLDISSIQISNDASEKTKVGRPNHILFPEPGKTSHTSKGEKSSQFDPFHWEDFSAAKSKSGGETTASDKENGSTDVLSEVTARSLREWEYKNGVRKNIRSLLSSLHTVLWQEVSTRWGVVELSALMSKEGIKEHYRKAILLVHPDRNAKKGAVIEETAKNVFRAINASWNDYNNSEKV